MTALCGGGPSAPNPGLGAQLIVPVGLITAGLALISPWLIPLAALLDGFTFDLVTQCAADPPACPVFDQTDAFNIVGGVLNPNVGVTLTKVQNLIKRYLWFQYCRCTTVATPSFDCFPAQPATVSIAQPVTVAPGCGGGQWAGVLPENYPSLNINDVVYMPTLLPRGALSISVQGPDFSQITAYSVPSGVTAIHLQGTVACAPANPAPSGAAIVVAFLDVVGNVINTSEINACTPGFADRLQTDAALPPNTVYWYAYGYFLYPTLPYIPQAATASVTALCGTSTAAQAVAPCVSDPAVLAMLDNISQLVKLIQRQQVPFAYVPGAVHTPLVGNGELAVQGLIGAKVEPTVLPVNIGQVAGDPDELWLDSWVTWGNADGWSDRVWLRHSPQITFPPLAGQFTKLGYSIRPGMAVTITELVREP